MAKTKIYIYGASGHGAVVSEVAMACGYNEVIFLDDNLQAKFNPNLEKADIIVAIGDNKTRAKIQEKVLNLNFKVVNLIHPSAVISKSAKFGVGVVVMPNVVVNARAVIEDGVILNTGCVVEHDCAVGRFSHISPNVAIAGNVKLGECVHMGILSTVIQGKKIGANSTIGAGAVVIGDIGENCTAVGVPAKIIKS